MPAINFSSVNWWAVLTAGLATFFLGAVWYQALFGKLWLRLHGYTPADVAEMQKSRPPAVFFGTMIAAYLLMAAVMALLDAGLAQRLELTDEQTAKIRKHLVENRPKPLEPPLPAGPGGFEAINKRQEAMIAQMNAYAAEQRAAVAVLNPGQLAKFTELTGYQPPPPPRNGFRPVRPAPKPGDEV